MASSVTEILLVILLIYAKVQEENAVAQQTDLDASNETAYALNATTVEARMPTSPATPSGCPELCACKESVKRGGIIVDCSERKLNYVPDFIPDETIYVNLKKNLIRTLTNASFAKWNTKNIQKINLSQNNISHIDKFAFKGFNFLWVIDLSDNNLTSVNKVRFPATHELNLESNPVRLKPASGFEESVFTSSQTRTGDCYAIYRRVKTNQMDDHWKYLEHVSHIMANIKCDHEPFLKSTSPIIVNPSITPQIDATIIPESKETITTPKNTPSTAVIEASSRHNLEAISIENNTSQNNKKNTTDNEPRVNHSKTIANTSMKEMPTPTTSEAFFYGSLLVVFSLLILFLILQKFDHSCYRFLKKKFTRQSTRRATVRGPIIHVQPLQRKQSHKPV